MNTKKLFIRTIALIIFAVMLANFSGCGSKKTIVKTTSETVVADPNYPEGKKVITTQVVEEEEDDDGCGGVLGCTIGFVGDVIALPFRAVGALIDFIF